MVQRKKLDLDWQAVRQDYEHSGASDAVLARAWGASSATTIRRRRVAEGWTRTPEEVRDRTTAASVLGTPLQATSPPSSSKGGDKTRSGLTGRSDGGPGDAQGEGQAGVGVTASGRGTRRRVARQGEEGRGGSVSARGVSDTSADTSPSVEINGLAADIPLGVSENGENGPDQPSHVPVGRRIQSEPVTQAMREARMAAEAPDFAVRAFDARVFAQRQQLELSQVMIDAAGAWAKAVLDVTSDDPATAAHASMKLRRVSLKEETAASILKGLAAMAKSATEIQRAVLGMDKAAGEDPGVVNKAGPRMADMLRHMSDEAIENVRAAAIKVRMEQEAAAATGKTIDMEQESDDERTS